MKDVLVKGRLKENILFWESIGASEWVLDIIREGYKIPFVSTPMSAFSGNNKSAFEETEFVTDSITKLLKNGSVKEVKNKPYIVNPLSVAKNSCGKLRLILDLRYVNRHVFKETVKFDDWKCFEKYIEKNGFLYKFDLKQGYHHIDIFQEHQKYLGFSWEFDGRSKYFIFTVLPFGLSPAPRVFTKVLRPLVGFWRGKGIKIAVYLDDGAGCEDNFEKTSKVAKFVKETLIKSGLVPSDKSIWEPVKILTWLGITVDLNKNMFFIPTRRIERILSLLEKVLATAYVSPRRLASLTGMIMSCKFVIGNIVRLKTRSFYFLIESRTQWDTKVNRFRYKNIEKDLLFWKENIKRLNYRQFVEFQIPKAFCFSDASSVAVGAIIKGKDIISHKNLRAEEKEESSTWRELFAIFNSLKDFKQNLNGKHVVWYTDNQASARIIEVGSGKEKLQELAATNVFEICRSENIDLNCEWIPMGKNFEADTVSKYIDYDDWSIAENLFDDINKKWGPFSIDRFADKTNRKVVRFNSKFHCENSEGVNAYIRNWGGSENNWIVPPINSISNVIRQAVIQKAKGVIVVPRWRSARDWPFLVKDNGAFREFVLDYIIVNNGCKRYIIKGPGSKNSNFQGDLLIF